MQLRASLFVAATLALVAADPATAADTRTTFRLTGGALSLSVGARVALRSSEVPAVAASVNTSSLGDVAVLDSRGGTAGWVVSATSATFTGSGEPVSSGVAYTNGVVTETGTTTVASVNSALLTSTATVVVTAGAVSGNNTAAWSPSLNVTVPAVALVGVYTRVVTTSLL